MNPVVVELESVLEAPPDVVWRAITDWERQGEWMLEASDFVVVSDEREGVDVVAEATVRIAGIATRDRIRVDAWELERRLGIVHLGWVKGRGDLWLEGTPDGTRLRWREELHPPLGPLGAVGLRLFRPFLVRTFERDLRELGDFVQRYPHGPVR